MSMLLFSFLYFVWLILYFYTQTFAFKSSWPWLAVPTFILFVGWLSFFIHQYRKQTSFETVEQDVIENTVIGMRALFYAVLAVVGVGIMFAIFFVFPAYIFS